MDELSKVIKVLLKRVPYELFLQDQVNSMALDMELFDKAVNSYFQNRSDTEIHYMLKGLSGILKNYADIFYGREQDIVTVFDALFYFANAILVRRNNEVMYLYNKALRWRMTTFDIGEEIFVTAFLAQQDLRQGREGKFFAWPAVISHNNIQLRNMTGKGMAENHFHLWGSAPYFHLSWIHLMNHLTDAESIRQEIEIDQNLRTHYRIYDTQQQTIRGIRDCCMRAALIRLFLFSRLTDSRIALGEYYVEWQCLIPWIEQRRGTVSRETIDSLSREEADGCSAVDFLRKMGELMEEDPLEEFYPALENILDLELDLSFIREIRGSVSIQKILNTMLQQQGLIRLSAAELLIGDPEEFKRLWRKATVQKVLYFLNNMEAYERHVDQIQDIIDGFLSNGVKMTYDYALDAEDFKTYNGDSVYYLLSGERWFLYQMFRKIARNDQDFSPLFYNFFYAYLIMKEQIRGELVQSNKKIGFENFQIYQDRKSFFAKGDFFDTIKARMAVISCIQQNVKLLELRITPGNTIRDNYEYIRFLDEAIDPGSQLQEKYFYVFHFIKKKDEPLEETFCDCRHSKLRNKIWSQAQALLGFRRKYPLTAKRVLGIDASSMEVGCRPEVFAVIFRALQRDVVRIYEDGNVDTIPQLQATYHVGEEFLDVVDGLRAIDEAVLFLDLSCGDRLGHALALGISVKDWYRSKQYNISLSKQDYLDNIVWLYFAIVRYNLEGLDNLKNYLEAEFHTYFDEIYRKHMDSRFIGKILEKSGKEYTGYPLDFNMQAYYDSWKLRGDRPDLYQNGYFEPLRFFYSPFDSCAVNENFPEDPQIRKSPEAALLYWFYHFDYEVRMAGNGDMNMDVKSEYVRGVELVQKAMQHEIAARGIAIETNPSSNYKIGTIKAYDEHPIRLFYNNGLTFDPEELKGSAQIWVSVNTDDQGVFSTILENEYALLARALEKKIDEKGNLVYQKTMIYEWLNKIRIMGLDQSFGNHRNSKIKEEIHNLDMTDRLEEELMRGRD